MGDVYVLNSEAMFSAFFHPPDNCYIHTVAIKQLFYQRYFGVDYYSWITIPTQHIKPTVKGIKFVTAISTNAS